MKSQLSTVLVVVVLAALAVLPACGSKGKTPESQEGGGKGAPKEEGHHEEGLLKLTAEQKANANLQLGKVERRSAAGFLEAAAEVQVSAEHEARVGSRVPGRVAQVKVRPGDKVTAGTTLLVVDSPDVGRAKADYLSALSAWKVATTTSERERVLYEKKISSEREWRQAESEAIKTRAERDAAENRLHALGVPDAELPQVESERHYSSAMPVVSPIDGVVVGVETTIGQMVDASAILATVMDLREVVVSIDVYDRDLSQVKAGQGVRAKLAAYPGREFVGKVQSIGATVEEKTRSVKVRVSLPNPDGALKPGMFATVTLEGTVGEARDRLVVPSAALQRNGADTFVFVPKGDEGFEPRKVKVLRSLGELSEIESGVVDGDTVVTAGSFFLKSELQKEELGGGHED